MKVSVHTRREFIWKQQVGGTVRVTTATNKLREKLTEGIAYGNMRKTRPDDRSRGGCRRRNRGVGTGSGSGGRCGSDNNDWSWGGSGSDNNDWSWGGSGCDC